MDSDRDDLNTQRASREPSSQPDGQSSRRPDGRPEPEAMEGVLGSLPRTRPQRASPRRAAQAKAKRASRAGATEPRAKQASGGGATEAKPKRADGKATAKGKPKRKPAPSRPARELPVRPKAPRQGYEPEEDLEIGRTVHPPSAVELAGSVADIALELASASLKSGGRLLRDVLSPLRRS